MRLQSRSHLVCLILALVVVTTPALLRAQVPGPPKNPAPQVSIPPEEPTGQIPSPPKKPVAQVPSPSAPKPSSAGGAPIPHTERRLGHVSLAVARDVRLFVDNRTTGRISVHGWDRDVIEAHAISDRGEEVLIVAQSEDDGPRKVFLKADYVNLENSESPTEPLGLPPLGSDGPLQVRLDVNVPRYVELELIRVIRSDVEISGVETPITVNGKESNVTLKDVGPVEAHTRTGSILVENAKGIADVTSSTGAIKISNSSGAVRVVSIAGSIEIRCFKGRIDVSNTQAPIELEAIEGDVEAIAASSDVSFKGRLNDDARYYLKSMSGRVEMRLPDDTRGFNATLTSYRGMVESDFSLHSKPSAQDGGTTGRRLSGRFGKGSPQITLDSFEGLVKLSKIPSTSIISCR